MYLNYLQSSEPFNFVVDIYLKKRMSPIGYGIIGHFQKHTQANRRTAQEEKMYRSLSTSGHLFRERLPGEMTAPGEPTHRGIAPAARTKKGDRLVVDHVDSMVQTGSFVVKYVQCLQRKKMTMFSR